MWKMSYGVSFGFCDICFKITIYVHNEFENRVINSKRAFVNSIPEFKKCQVPSVKNVQPFQDFMVDCGYQNYHISIGLKTSRSEINIEMYNIALKSM